jgi:hypothetical protein
MFFEKCIYLFAVFGPYYHNFLLEGARGGTLARTIELYYSIIKSLGQVVILGGIG